jgi:glycine oxidase
MPHPDVFIVGGGIIGLTTAYALAKRGVSVAVADRGELGHEASWAGAGIIPPQSKTPPANPFDRLRAYSVSLFPALSQELKARTGIDNEYHHCGGIECLSAEDADAVALWQSEGVPYERLDDPRRTHPWLNVPAGTTAYSLPYGQVRNPRHLAALIEACRQVGVRLWPHQVVEPSALPPAGKYLIAVGAWANLFLEPFGLPPLVHPVRGQIVLFQSSQAILNRILLVGHRYLVPRLDGRILVGSTEEPGAGFQKGNTPEGVDELIHFAVQLIPALKTAPVEKTWSGLRPGSRDGFPYLGPVPGSSNVFAAIGHFRSGVQLSPGTGEVMAAMLLGEPPPIPTEAFRLDRPPVKTMRPAFRS